MAKRNNHPLALFDFKSRQNEPKTGTSKKIIPKEVQKDYESKKVLPAEDASAKIPSVLPSEVKREDKAIWESLKGLDVNVAVFKGGKVNNSKKDEGEKKKDTNTATKEDTNKKQKEEGARIQNTKAKVNESLQEAEEVDAGDLPNCGEGGSINISEETVVGDFETTEANRAENERICFVKRPITSKRETPFEEGRDLNKNNAIEAVKALDMQNVSKRGPKKPSFSCDLCHHKFANRSLLTRHRSANHSQGSVLLPVSSEYGDRTSLVSHFEYNDRSSPGSELETDFAETVNLKEKSKDTSSPPPRTKSKVVEEEEEDEELDEDDEAKNEDVEERSETKDPDWVPESEPNLVTTIVKVESFECKHCAAVYDNEIKLVKHQSRRHWQKKRFHKYKCDVCGATFRFRHNLRKHNEDTHNAIAELTFVSVNFKCDICNVTFEYEDALKLHVEHTHNRQQREEYSQESLTPTENLEDIMERDSSSQSENLDIDIGETQIEEALSELVKDKVQSEQREEEPDEELEEESNRKTSRSQELGSKMKKNKYECKNCDSSFKVWDKLRKHIKTAHEQDNARKAKVDKDKNLENLNEKEMNRSSSDSLYEANGSEPCSLCEEFKTFDSPKLRRHVKMHQKSPNGQVEPKKNDFARKNKRETNHAKEKVNEIERPDENTNVDALFEEFGTTGVGGFKDLVTLEDCDLLVLTEMSPEKQTTVRKSVSFNANVLQQDFDAEICQLDSRNRLVRDLDEMVRNRKRINDEIQELLAMEKGGEPAAKKMKISAEKPSEESQMVGIFAFSCILPPNMLQRWRGSFCHFGHFPGIFALFTILHF